jgi:NAD(P)-dependent dehydrogenase (short-subunit alcohol dehydrogenase family)
VSACPRPGVGGMQLGPVTGRVEVDTLFSLAGHRALVTGGSRGIGRMIAEGFVQAGATVFISSRSADECRTAAAEIAGSGGTCIALPEDLSSPTGAARLAEGYRKHEDRLDILVNNAGTTWAAPLTDYPEAGWDKVINLNLKAPFFVAQALLGPLRLAANAATPAKVINIASIAGFLNEPWETYAYHASKAGVIQLTRRLAAQLIRDGINVTAIAPGVFPSKLNRAARDYSEQIGQRIPAGRVGQPEDIAGAAIFLASRAGDYVVGETIVVDGGLTHATLTSALGPLAAKSPQPTPAGPL